MNAPAGSDAPLGRIVELRRTALGLKRKDLAERARLSYPYISEIENGVKEPSAKALRQIAEALELTVAELAALSERVRDTPSAPSVLEDVARPSESISMLRSHLVAGAPQIAAARAPRRPLSRTPLDSVDAAFDPELRALVQRLVGDEVQAWLETNLPGLIATELEARHAKGSPEA